MKKYLLLASLLFSSLFSKAQTDSIPNSGFEDWFFAGWGVNPRGWYVNNTQILPANVVPDSMSHSGILGMMLINSGNFRPYASCGIPLTQHPLTLTGYLKNQLNTGDTATIRVLLYLNSQVVDSAFQNITGGITSGYVSFIVPISQNSSGADSCEVILEGGNAYLSQISYDDLSLTFSTGIEEHEKILFSLSPNPCSEMLIVRFEENRNTEIELIVCDVYGRKISEEKIREMRRETSINTTALSAGVYFLSAKRKGHYQSLSFIKQ